jgi:tetratricopeptide (TPR) repeat protein
VKYRALLILGFLLVPAAYSQVSRGDLSVQELCRKARAELHDGNYAQARATATNAVKLNGGSAEAQCLLGEAEFALGNLPAAEEHLQKALGIDPALPEAHRVLGATFLRQRQFKAAQGQFEDVLKAHPDDFSCLYGLGMSLLGQNEPAQALGQLVKAYQMNPSDSEVLTDIMGVHLKLGQSKQALADLAELNRRFAQDYAAQMQVAEVLVHEGAYDLAASQFKQLLKARPDSYELNYDLALAYHRAGEEDQAAAQLRKMLAQGDKAELENLLGSVEEKRGNYPQALMAFRRAAELAPKNEEYQLDFATEIAFHWNPIEAVKAFAAELKNFPNSAKLWMGLGGSYYLLAKYSDAVDSLLHASRLAPGNPDVYALLGLAYDAAGPRQKDIEKKFRDYIKTHPSDALAHYFYGKILLDQSKGRAAGGLDQARRQLDTAIGLNPSLVQAHLELATLLRMRGDTQGARSQLETAVKLDPKSSNAYYQLMQVYEKLGQRQEAEMALQKFRQLKNASNQETGREQVIKILGHDRQ